MGVPNYLKAKKLIEPILLLVFNKNLAGFVTFYFALCSILAYSNNVRTYEMLLNYDLHIRNTDPQISEYSERTTSPTAKY